MIELPDISHLTPEEQQKIRDVVRRQQEEEEKEKNMLKVLHDQFEDYKSHIKMVQEKPKASTPEDNDPVCPICLKTKFAEGCGHVCAFCEIKFCSRCGGRMTTKCNKVVWVCNTCRKQKEIICSLGSRPNSKNDKGPDSPKPLKERNGNEREVIHHTNKVTSHPELSEEPCTEATTENKKEKLVKEILKQPRMHATPGSHDVSKSNEMAPVIGEIKQKLNAETGTGTSSMKKVGTVPNFRTSVSTQHIAGLTQSASALDISQGKILSGSRSFTKPPQELGGSPSYNLYIRGGKGEKPSRAPAARPSSKQSGEQALSSRRIQATVHHNDHLSTPSPHRNGFTSQRMENCVNTGMKDESGSGRQHMRVRQRSIEMPKRNSHTIHADSDRSLNRKMQGCQSEPNISGCYCKNEIPRDSSTHRKFIRRQQYNRRGLFMRDISMSSSEDDIQSTTEYSSFDDVDKETSISDNEYIYSQTMRDFPHRMCRDPCHHGDHCMDSMTKSSTSLCSCQRSTSNNPDSGVESGSVLCVDGSQQDQLPVTWNPSSDGRFLIGHLVLYKNISSTSLSARQAGALLGLKVVGGKSTPSGRLGAFVTKVKKGSLAETIGHLKPGDEIISWNKYCLQDATFDQVYEIILESKEDPMVELVVSRPITYEPRIPETRPRQTVESSSCSLDSERRDYEPSNAKPLQGKIQIRIWYDNKTQQLYVTAMRAIDLPLREGGLPRNPYLKMLLLPGGSNTFKRRTKTAKKTLSPEWMQTFVYSDVRKDDLGAMALELTLWDYDRSLEANNKFMGEVMIDLGLVCLDDEPHWFRLMPLCYGMNQDYILENNTSYDMTHTTSMSSENNFTEDSNNNGKIVPCRRQHKSSHAKIPKSPSTLPKRRLPHVPKSLAQEAPIVAKIVQQEAKQLIEKRVSSIKTDSERAVSEENWLQNSGNSVVEFDTLSVDQTFQTFVGGVGPGQVVGRQALALTSVGEIELGLYERRSQLEVKVVRARRLACMRGAKVRPAHYVKVYMMLGQQCTAKKKTKIAPRSFDPNFDQTLVFDSGQPGNALQVIVWGDYGRMDNKVFVGMVQISLDEVDLSTYVIAWYKLFPTSSVIDASAYGPRKESYSSFGSSSQTLA